LEYLSAAIAGSVACPPEYGKILYECNPTNQKQLFIIGMGHRDALTRSNGSQTAKIQAEVYKIGEWLVRQEGVELLLPEGFFKNPGAKTVPSPLPPQPERKGFGKPLDLKTLEAKLSDQRTFLNAEILLKRNYPIVLQQVEDKNCYEEVGERLRRISACRYSAEEYGHTKAELDYLQEKRTALMLQKIPAIINNEYGAENIKTRKAILTIGLAHIPMIRKYLIDRKIRIDSPPPSMRAHEAHFAGLTLLEQNFRISIFLPKSLADTPNILKMNTLGKNVSGLSASSGITNQRTTIFSH
jgi:hypothetical protein